jgi:uncharacterized protein YdhG (YjbR/CyaY superfamily)
MESTKGQFATIDEYISSFPDEVGNQLQALRRAIKEEAPEAQEAISYQMPTFTLHGNLVHFAAYKNHIGFYPTPSGVEAFIAELSPYKTGKGTLQFPLDQPLPLPLIRKVVKLRVKENLEKKAKKK